MNTYFKKTFFTDFTSSIVVFLVALPLCMGIAIASGVPPIMGLLSGIIGGIVVGLFAGAPLQVSGPAAGLAVMVYEFVSKYGLESLAPLGVIVGVSQLLIYRFRLAGYFRAISPALIKGLLSGIGLLILASQVHVAFDSNPIGGGLVNLMHIPKSFNEFVLLEGGGRIAFFIALATLGTILIWQKFAGKLNGIMPAPLMAILVVATGTYLLESDVKFVTISPNIVDDLNLIALSHFSKIDGSFIVMSLAIAFVASAETLLSVAAVDKLVGEGNSNYNKEIMAQGIGNVLAGIVGGLPITGVIVRSSANIESGAKTRGSAIMHGFWLFGLVFFFTSLLGLIPISALAGILIYVGWKLLDVKGVYELFKRNKAEAFIYFTTFSLIVAVDLLTGVVVGFLASVAVLVYNLHQLEVFREETQEHITLKFKGTASFLKVPQISQYLSGNDEDKKVTLDLIHLDYMDEAVKQQLEMWEGIRNKRGVETEILYNKMN